MLAQLIATAAVVQSDGHLTASVIVWQDLALVVVGLLLLASARYFMRRRRRAEADSAPAVPMIDAPPPPPGVPARRPPLRPASPSQRAASRDNPQPAAVAATVSRGVAVQAGRESARDAAPLSTATVSRGEAVHAARENARDLVPLPATDDRGEAVQAGVVRFHRPPDGTLQLLPGRLEVLSGKEGLGEIRFVRVPGTEPVVTFGRSPGEPHTHIELQSPTVSRRHAAMRFEDGGWHIANLSTTNPVIVRGRPLALDDAPVRLEDGDQVEMGEVTFRFRGPPVAARPAHERPAEPARDIALQPVAAAHTAVAAPPEPPEPSPALVAFAPAAAAGNGKPSLEPASGAVFELVALPETNVSVAAPPQRWSTSAPRRARGRSIAVRVEGLSQREIEIARLAAAGHSNRVIGDMLRISARTVSTHLTHIFRKLNVSTRGELAEHVSRNGLG